MTPIVSSLIPIMIALLLCPPKQALSLAATYILTVTEACGLEAGQQLERAAFGQQLGTHEKRAKADRNDDDSRFYSLFPHSDSVRANSRATGGIFEYLTPFIAKYFTMDAASCTDFSNSGLFLYTNKEKRRISSVNFSGKSGEKNYMQMIAYLFELGY